MSWNVKQSFLSNTVHSRSPDRDEQVQLSNILKNINLSISKSVNSSENCYPKVPERAASDYSSYMMERKQAVINSRNHLDNKTSAWGPEFVSQRKSVPNPFNQGYCVDSNSTSQNSFGTNVSPPYNFAICVNLSDNRQQVHPAFGGSFLQFAQHNFMTLPAVAYDPYKISTSNQPAHYSYNTPVEPEFMTTKFAPKKHYILNPEAKEYVPKSNFEIIKEQITSKSFPVMHETSGTAAKCGTVKDTTQAQSTDYGFIKTEDKDGSLNKESVFKGDKVPMRMNVLKKGTDDSTDCRSLSIKDMKPSLLKKEVLSEQLEAKPISLEKIDKSFLFSTEEKLPYHVSKNCSDVDTLENLKNIQYDKKYINKNALSIESELNVVGEEILADAVFNICDDKLPSQEECVTKLSSEGNEHEIFLDNEDDASSEENGNSSGGEHSDDEEEQEEEQSDVEVEEEEHSDDEEEEEEEEEEQSDEDDSDDETSDEMPEYEGNWKSEALSNSSNDFDDETIAFEDFMSEGASGEADAVIECSSNSKLINKQCQDVLAQLLGVESESDSCDSDSSSETTEDSGDSDYDCEVFVVNFEDDWGLSSGLQMSDIVSHYSLPSNCCDVSDGAKLEMSESSSLNEKSEKKYLQIANEKWNSEIENELTAKSPVRVKFCDDIVVHPMVTWSYAYKKSRRGPWEQHARDRMRFKRRIEEVSCILLNVFNPDHRDKMYNKLYGKP